MNWMLPAAKMFNRLGVPYPYLNMIACGSSNILTEIKFEVTERCNLACTFCHQDFGAKGGTDDLDRDTYERILAAAKNEHIPLVRLTGGEPLLLKSTDEFLRRAKNLGFKVIVNTNAMPLTEKRLQKLQGLVDCFKISLPAADEETMTRLTGNRTTWRKKWEAIDRLQTHGFNTEILTVMTAENIRQFDRFLQLLGPHEKLRWLLLRAESQEGDTRPVTKQDIRDLAGRISEARRSERWKGLTLGLATPYCVLENPYDAVELFTGGSTCGPVQSLTVTSQGTVASCYSRRDPIDRSKGLRAVGSELAMADFDRLPEVCRQCPLCPDCRGGCHCELALEETPFGKLDYLAEPARMAHAKAFAAAS